MAALSYHNNMGGIVESSAKLFALGRYLLVHIVESYPPRAEEEGEIMQV